MAASVGVLTPVAVSAGDLVTSFTLGLLTPLTAVCVIPLYPGFLAYLSNQSRGGARDFSVAQLGGLVAAGVVSFMLLFGVVFATVLEVSLTNVVGIVSPVAFAVLGLGSLALVADVNVERYLPAVEPPQSSHPVASAFGYGFFFGAVVLPCNPGLLAVFFARAFLFTSPVANVANFLAFGSGMAAPLFGLAVVAEPWSERVVDAVMRHRTAINRLTGVVMFAVSVYYLFVVFRVQRAVGL